MSRLYSWIKSDTGRGGDQTKTITGNQHMQITVNYGSKSNSKRVFILNVDFPKGAEYPEIHLFKGGNIK
jgi:hypothetical protein